MNLTDQLVSDIKARKTGKKASFQLVMKSGMYYTFAKLSIASGNDFLTVEYAYRKDDEDDFVQNVIVLLSEVEGYSMQWFDE